MGASLSYFVMIHTSVRYQNLALSYKKEIEQTHKFSSEHYWKNIYNVPMVQNKNIRFDNTDFVAENLLVDKLSPGLSSNEEVIDEALRIHTNMFSTLIGHYKYAMLFNFAAFENKGDPAITAGELILLQKLGIDLVFHCQTMQCKGHTLDHAYNISKGYGSMELVILMHGGGNIFSYTHEDTNRRRVLETFQEFEIILFPQSIWPKASDEHKKLFKRSTLVIHD